MGPVKGDGVVVSTVAPVPDAASALRQLRSRGRLRGVTALCREHLPTPVSRGLWVQAEIIAMATDLAESVGAAVGLYLLFHVPPGLITAVVAFAILALEQRGYRRFELAIVGLLGIVFLGFLYDLVVVGADPSAAASGLIPRLAGGDSLLLTPNPISVSASRASAVDSIPASHRARRPARVSD